MQMQMNEGFSPYVLPSHLTIETAEMLATALKTHASGRTDMALDMSGVEVMTTPGLQIIAALAKTFAARNAQLQLVHPRESVARTFTQAGLGPLLMMQTS